MFNQGLQYLLDTLLGLITIGVLLRFYLQLTGASYYNPVSQAVVSATNFIVRPARRFIPSWRSLDLSTLVLAFIAQLLLQLAHLWFKNYPLAVASFNVYVTVCALALLSVINLSINIFLFAVVIQAIMSWVNPHTGAAEALDSLSAPLLNPVRRIIGNTGGMDFSPLVVFVLAQLVFIWLIVPIENLLAAQL
jgi:YggT family protein